MDTNWNCKKSTKKKRVNALTAGWTLIGIAKKNVKRRGLMHQGAGGYRLDCKTKCKSKRIDTLGGRWRLTGLPKVQK